MQSPRLISTKKVCAKQYLNTPVNEKGERDFSLEDYFQKIENEAASYWSDIEATSFPFDDPVSRKKLSEFLAALHLRNKFVSDMYRKLTDSIEQFLNGSSNAEEGRSRPTDPKDAVIDPIDPDQYFAQSTQRDIPRITEMFFEYHWTIIKLENVLVTSDRPVTFDTPGSRPGGPGNKGATAVVPISPHIALVMDSATGNKESTKVCAASNISARLNELIIRKADRFVLACSSALPIKYQS